MLVSIHQNANIWHLFIGDRAIVDTLLNKTMISFTGPCAVVAAWLHAAYFLQLVAMTRVAAQKGYDGIFLLALMLTMRALE